MGLVKWPEPRSHHDHTHIGMGPRNTGTTDARAERGRGLKPSTRPVSFTATLLVVVGLTGGEIRGEGVWSHPSRGYVN